MTILHFLEDFDFINKLLLEKEKEGFFLNEAVHQLIFEQFRKEGINMLELENYEVEHLNKVIKGNLILSFLHAIKISPDDNNEYLIVKYNVRYKKYYSHSDFARSLVLPRHTKTSILTQGFTKFNNLGEKGITPKDIQTKIDNGEIAYAVDKLDGTNITSRFVKNQLVTNSTGSLSKIINEYQGKLQPNYIVDSEEFIKKHSNYLDMIKEHPDTSFIFEYISSDNVIIVEYDEWEYGLNLIGARKFLNKSGTESRLLTQPELAALNEKYQVGYKGYQEVKNVNDLINYVNSDAYKGKEGVVVYIGDEIYKIKADDYVLVHQLKMKYSLKTEKDLKLFIRLLTPLMVNESLDDYIGVYKGNIPNFVTLLIKEIDKDLTAISLQIDVILNEHKHLESKPFHQLINKSDYDDTIKKLVMVKYKHLDYNRLLIGTLIDKVYKRLVDNFPYQKDIVKEEV